MADHGFRSKERVVRLETFFGAAAVAAGVANAPAATSRGTRQRFFPVKTGPRPAARRALPAVQAARRSAGAVAAAAASKRTEIRFDTPDSSIVTP